MRLGRRVQVRRRLDVRLCLVRRSRRSTSRAVLTSIANCYCFRAQKCRRPAATSNWTRRRRCSTRPRPCTASPSNCPTCPPNRWTTFRSSSCRPPEKWQSKPTKPGYDRTMEFVRSFVFSFSLCFPDADFRFSPTLVFYRNPTNTTSCRSNATWAGVSVSGPTARCTSGVLENVVWFQWPKRLRRLLCNGKWDRDGPWRRACRKSANPADRCPGSQNSVTPDSASKSIPDRRCLSEVTARASLLPSINTGTWSWIM